jgi:hypothetical protein
MPLPPARLTIPGGPYQANISDLYDRTNAAISAANNALAAAAAATSTTTTTTIVQNITADSIEGASGTASGPQYAFVPALATVPNNNPTTGAPYAQDGLVIEFAPTTGDSGVLFRYTAGATFSWAYMDGTLYRTQSQLTALAGSLSAVHAGLLVSVTDYLHVLRWTGSGWQWGPGESGSGMGPVPFEVDPGTGWALYDGAAHNYLKSDGTIGSVMLPNISGVSPTGVFLEYGAANSGLNAATNGTVTASGSALVSGSTGNDSGTQTVMSGTGATVPAEPHTHPVTLSGSASVSGSSTGALPPNLIRRAFFRQ